MITSTTLETFEAAGLAALVRAGDTREWFNGHFGAAMISGARLLADPNLPGPAALALNDRLASMLESHRDWYSPLSDAGTTVVGVEPILVVLRRSAGHLRTSGHPTIYMTAALRVLSREPSLATERVIASLVTLHEAACEDHPSRYYGHADYFAVVDRPGVDLASKPAEVALAEAVRTAFEALDHLVADQQIDGRHYFLTGEKIHLITHLHAIVTLEELGHLEIAVAACRAQGWLSHLVDASNAIPASEVEVAKSTPIEAGFWEQKAIDPAHVIKLAEAVMLFLPRMTVSEQAMAKENLACVWSLLGIR